MIAHPTTRRLSPILRTLGLLKLTMHLEQAPASRSKPQSLAKGIHFPHQTVAACSKGIDPQPPGRVRWGSVTRETSGERGING